MLADYHVHSQFSDDSRESMEAQIARAIELKLDELCFTDHVDYGIKKDWSEGDIEYRGGDGMNGAGDDREPLANVDYPRYFDALRSLKQKYADQLVIRAGLEFGIQTCTLDQYRKLYDQWKHELDFVLLSMHQVDNQEFWTQDFQRGKTQREYNEAYYDEIYRVMQAYKDYSVLAHLDLIVRYDRQGVYPFALVRDQIAEILRLAIRDGKGLEFNTSSWHYGLDDTQPSRAILRLYRDLGGTILTMGSDAHSTRWLGDHFPEAREILQSLGFREIYTFDHLRPIEHQL